jgi:hypothetical protein
VRFCRWLSSAFAIGAFFASSPVLADDRIAVTVESCSMRSDELERLVKLELSSVLDASAAGGYVVSIRCNGDQVSIALRDPLTRKGLDRTVVAPPPSQPEPERLLALTIAQLYRASWLELAAEPSAPLEPPASEKRSAAELDKARQVAVQTLPAPPPVLIPALPPLPPKRRPPRAALGVSVGGRVRAPDTPLLLPSVDLRASWLPAAELVWLTVAPGVEWATVTRTTGSLSVLVLRGDLGVTIEPLKSGPWSGFAEMEAGVAVARIAAEALAGYRADTALGPGFEGSIGIGAAARVDVIRFELVGRVGLLHGTPAGIVAGDEDLSLDGISGGLDVRVRWML